MVRYMSTSRIFNSLNITMFVSSQLQLVKDPKCHIMSSDLYARYRRWCEMQNIDDFKLSDVQLAEKFSTCLSSKRIAAGKAWINCKFAYDMDWAGPTKIEKMELVTTPGCYKFSVLGVSAIRNLKLEGITKSDVADVTLNICGIEYILAPDKEGNWTPKDLWISRPIVLDYDVSINITSSSSYIKMELEYSNDVPNAIYCYSNQVNNASYSVAGKKFTLNIDHFNGTLNPNIDWSVQILPEIAGFFGVKVKERGITGLLAAQAKAPPGKPTYAVTSLLDVKGDRFAYFERRENKYYQCLNIRVNVDCDLLAFNTKGIPIGHYTVTVNGETISDGNIINLVGSREKILLCYKSTYGVETVDGLFNMYGPVASFIFGQYRPMFNQYYLGTESRRAAGHLKFIYSDILSAFTSIKQYLKQ
jgi:hypothetical protein